jgi:hypothetical protein
MLLVLPIVGPWSFALILLCGIQGKTMFHPVWQDNVSSCLSVCLTRQCFILSVRLSDKIMFHPVCPFVWQDNVSSCLSVCLTRQCFILSVRLSHFPSITKVCTCNFSYILNRNSLKLGRLTYFHMKNCILLQQFDRTIFEEVVLFTKNISSKVV